MKKSIIAAVAGVIVMLCSAIPAQAQFKFGIKAGIDVNSLHFNQELFDSDNRTGFTGGVMAQFIAPGIGFGFDISAMYVRRDFQASEDVNGVAYSVTSHRDYIEIPVNLKYMVNIPAIGNVLKPFVTTGPSVAFLTSKTGINDALKNKTVDCTWNFGLGLEFFNHLQIAASYGIGLSNSVVSTLTDNYLHNEKIDGKTHCWTVTAAYLF